mgnify:CR=1 FL=1
MNSIKNTIKEAIDIFSQETDQSWPRFSRVDISSDAARERMAKLIDKYIKERYPAMHKAEDENEDCCGNDCGCH